MKKTLEMLRQDHDAAVSYLTAFRGYKDTGRDTGLPGYTIAATELTNGIDTIRVSLAQKSFSKVEIVSVIISKAKGSELEFLYEFPYVKTGENEYTIIDNYFG